MEASDNMKLLASWMSVCLDIELPDFEDFYATRKYIAEYKKDFDELPDELKRKSARKAKVLSYQVSNIKSEKLKFAIGNWLGRKMRNGDSPFDTIDNINATDRYELAKNYWKDEAKQRYMENFKKLDGREMSLEELFLFIAKDLDYRIIKNTAKYVFNITDKSAGALVINPDDEPFCNIKIQYLTTYHTLCDESFHYGLNDGEKRTYIR